MIEKEGLVVPWPALAVVYWAIPKAGCTTVRTHLQRLSGESISHEEPLSVHQRVIPRALGPDEICQSPYTQFTVIRHPVARFVSAWRDLSWVRTVAIPKRWKGFRRHMTASEFMDLIEKTRASNVHVVPQSRLLRGSPPHLKKFRLEHLREDWDLPLPPPDLHLNKSETVPLDSSTEARVRRYYEGDFQLGGYE